MNSDILIVTIDNVEVGRTELPRSYGDVLDILVSPRVITINLDGTKVVRALSSPILDLIETTRL
jgi:hypothetical protein